MGPGPAELIAILFAMGTPAFIIFYFGKRWFQLKERRLEVEAMVAQSRMTSPPVGRDVEKRLAVLERIVTEANTNSLSREIDALMIERPLAREASQ